jgi:hypothetical protein
MLELIGIALESASLKRNGSVTMAVDLDIAGDGRRIIY